MSRDAHLRWLYEELPGLVKRGLLDAEAADALRAHYGEPREEASATSRALVIFGVLGGLLVGLGIILLFAYNWDTFSRGAKTLVSFLPLVAGQALTAYAVLRRPRSKPWREGAGTFLFIAVGATLGLISQVYQIGGSTGDFLFVWLLLTALLPYAVKADVPAFLHLGGVLFWATFSDNRGELDRLWYWLLAAMPLAHVWWRMRDDRDDRGVVVLRWAYAIVLLVGFFFSYDRLVSDMGPALPATFFAMLYLLDQLWMPARQPEGMGYLRRPFHVVGGVALAILGLAGTFSDLWDELGSLSGLELSNLDWVKLAALLLLYAYLAWRASTGRRVDLLVLAGLPLTAMLGQALLEAGRAPELAAWLFTLHLFAGSVWGIARGLRDNHFATVSTSLGLLSLLILLRFFDGADILSRAIAFIVVGTGFLVANYALARRMKV